MLHSRFAAEVARTARNIQDGADRGHTDDTAASDHVTQRLLKTKVRALGIECVSAIEVFFGDVFQRLEARVPRVRHQDVESIEAFGSLAKELPDILQFGNVGLDGYRLAALSLDACDYRYFVRILTTPRLRLHDV